MEVISFPQPGHFMEKHCNWSPGAMPSIGKEVPSEERATEKARGYEVVLTQKKINSSAAKAGLKNQGLCRT